jgi:predicted RNA polymerase sigma factor
LDEQDRTRWNRELIAEGAALVAAALPLGAVGLYQLQAAIAAIHDEAPSTEKTDWMQIVRLYEMLKSLTDNPMVSLNHAIAVAMVRGPGAGLRLLDSLDSDARIAGHYRLNAVRGHLYERAGDREKAVGYYRSAAESTASIPERDYLLNKAARLSTTYG